MSAEASKRVPGLGSGRKRDYTQDPGGTVARQKSACGKARDSRVTGNRNSFRFAPSIGPEKRATVDRTD